MFFFFLSEHSHFVFSLIHINRQLKSSLMSVICYILFEFMILSACL